MKKLKWDGFCHVVVDGFNSDLLVDMHSHGLKREIGTEFQYIINVGKREYFEERIDLFLEIAESVLNGKLNINDNKPFTVKNWSNAKFKFYKTKDSARKPIVRIIECDMRGRFPEDNNCSNVYNLQYSNDYHR